MLDSINKKTHNITLDFVKGLACFFILWMHTNSGGIVNSIIVCVARFGIPVFFMVSGYFTYRENVKNFTKVLQKKIIHIVKLIIIATLVYIVWSSIFQPIINNGQPQDLSVYFKPLLRLKVLINLLVLNVNPFGGILWFLNALLYCYLLWLLIAKINNKKIIYIIGIAILLLGIIARGFILYKNLIPEEVNINFFSNWLFMGLPFFIIGYAIYEYKDYISSKISNSILIIAMILGLLLSFGERKIVPLEVFFGTVVFAVSIFVFAINNPKMIKIPIFNRVGERFCFFIYIAHPIVRDIILIVFKKMGISENRVVLFVNPIVVFILCYLIATIYCCLADKMKSINKNRKG